MDYTGNALIKKIYIYLWIGNACTKNKASPFNERKVFCKSLAGLGVIILMQRWRALTSMAP
jgi:hypothetical protein